jgi:hypothetical protein
MKTTQLIIGLTALLAVAGCDRQQVVISHGQVVGDRTPDSPGPFYGKLITLAIDGIDLITGDHNYKRHLIKDLDSGKLYRVLIRVEKDTLSMYDKGAFILNECFCGIFEPPQSIAEGFNMSEKHRYPAFKAKQFVRE